MAAYFVFTRVRTKDQQALDTYTAQATPAMAGRDFTVHAAYGELNVLEGEAAKAVAIIAFPTVTAALDWYHGPDYTAAREHRFRGADYNVVLVQGV